MSFALSTYLNSNFDYVKPYEGDYVINTDNKSVEQIVNEMKAIIDKKENE